jgi:hypothetical protein
VDRSTTRGGRAMTTARRAAARGPLLRLGAFGRSHPEAQQESDGLGDPSLSRDPVPHRAGSDSEPGRGGELTQAEAFERRAQLPGGHGHAGIKIGTKCRCLADRHIMPILKTWPHFDRARRSDTSAPRSDCWSRSRMTCASRASTCRRATRRSTAGDAGLGHAPRSDGSCSPVQARSFVVWASCSDSGGGRYACSYNSSTRCARSRGSARSELWQWSRRRREARNDALSPDLRASRLNGHQIWAIDRRQEQAGTP